MSPTELSPATQAVLDAYWESPWDPNLQHEDRFALAAALRAAADQAHRSIFKTAPSNDWGKGWKEGIRSAANGLLAIADEIEAQ
jgi:hypothetical protein